MDGARFDRLTKGLMASGTRRSVLVGAVVAALGGILTARAKSEKIGVCHHTGSEKNPLVFIEVSEHAAKAHEAHGDSVGVDLQSDHDNCGECGHVCGFRQACVAGECVDVAVGACATEPGSQGQRCACFDANGTQCTPVTACQQPDGSGGGHHGCSGDCLCQV
jgi:hypothetical protein